MEKELYQISVSNSDGNTHNSFHFFECDDDALKAANDFLRNSRKTTSVKVKRFDETPNTHLASCITIYENSTEYKLALSKKQKDAIKKMYAALEKVQNLGVHLVERDDGAMLAFNGNNIKEWCTEMADGEDEYNIYLEGLYYAGPPFYEAMAHGSVISVIFK